MKFVIPIAFFIFTHCTHVIKYDKNERVSNLDSVEVALVQYRIEGNLSLIDFLEKVTRLTRSARKQGAKLVVFPELITLDMWSLDSNIPEKEALNRIAYDSPLVLKHLRELAQKEQVFIISGSMPTLVDTQLFNRSHFITSSGGVFKQDKMTLTPWGKKMGFKTGRKINIISTPWGLLAILICYDVESPLLSAQLTKFAPHLDIIVVPSMTESSEGLRRIRHTSMARAIEHHAFVLVAGTVGRTSKNWNHFGQGLIAGPQYPGYPPLIAEGKLNLEGIVRKSLDLKKLRETKAKGEFYPALEKLNTTDF